MSRFKAFGPAQQYFSISTVSLGLGRVYLGLLLLFDLLRRWGDLDVWYTNAGLMPNHTMLWAPQAQLGYSIFFGASQLQEARALVLLIGCVYLAYTLGFRTRLMQVLAVLAHASLDCRIHYLTNGGDVALSVLLLWTAFLPLGDWLSVDALLRKLKHSKLQLDAKGVASLKTAPEHPELFAPPAPRFEWAMGALVVQLAVIYFFNFIHKDGPGWREGRVLNDVLHQERIVTALGVWVRPYVTEGLSRALTVFTLVVEGGLPLLLLVPLNSLWLRRLAVALGIGLHVGFALCMNLGIFSAAMVGFWVFLIPHVDAVRLLGWLRAAPSRGVLYFDSDCGICGTVARTLLCVQATSPSPSPFVIKGNEVAPADFKNVTAAQVDASILWVGPDGAQRWKGEAMAEVARAFILGRPLAWVLRLGVVRRAYEAFAARRHLVSAFFGLGVCGITRKVEGFAPEAPAVAARARWARTAWSAGLAALAVVFVVQVLAQNRAVPAAIKPVPPTFVRWPVEYLHFYQGWGMFAESPRTDSTVVVRAQTVDGRLVDPLSERASPRSPPGATSIIERLDHSEYFCDYLSRIANDGAYHPPLRDWLLAYPQRTGDARDSLKSFQVVELTQVSPALGQRLPTEQKERVLLTYP